jgi:EAL domain-containing protein (putative c-di-GMP-specific phosphodiesterase class I)
LSFTLAAQRLPGKYSKAEQALRGLRLAVAGAQSAGGNRCELDLREPVAPSSEDPRLRLVRAILRGPVDERTDLLEFQPWVPLSGDLVGQYVVRLRLRPPKASQSMLIGADEYLPIARASGLAVQADQRLARACLRRLRARPGGPEGLRLCLPLTVESLLEPAFAPWLAAELRSHGVQAGAMVLEFSARELIEQQPSEAALEALQRVGARLCLYADADEAAIARWLQHAAFGVVRWPRPAAEEGDKAPSPWAALGNAFASLRSHGKGVVAAEVSSMSDLLELLRTGVRYAHGPVLCDWLTDFSYDFSVSVL